MLLQRAIEVADAAHGSDVDSGERGLQLPLKRALLYGHVQEYQQLLRFCAHAADLGTVTDQPVK
jgi:hypothetical protein